MRRPLILMLALAAAGCDRPQRGTEVSIRDEGGNVVAGVDGKTGEIKVDVPGFEGSLKLPKINVDAGDIDLNGVSLYPGSTVDRINVAGGEAWSGQEAGLRVGFSSPAAAQAVRDWFAQKLGQVGFRLSAQGNALTGTTQDGKPFRLEMKPAGEAVSTGEIVIG